ncbi:3',5'-cyclic adenosine monophosphate phosphodiesterase CpdA [Microbacterium pseudoresistens]|uniref:3',5'-cyclic AMP phosphodiesterase CpdA n=1 Tax=Microbacterium pseudoresistens TaxID=640634 RepID=A0A7Y9EW82_9MICO|nr:metallophosphoesterase [Microbacterium pseudoresistens]NYD55110.1 3',5'-cyclic AMP phosphodiesterase CpdA [Microbacterium pseudoresistens]
MPQFGRFAPPTHTLIHLSDPHLLAGGAALGGRFDVDANLARTLRAIESAAENPDAIVVTGDLADLGEPEVYRRLRASVEPVAERLGAPVIWVAGNHDERPALREHLLGAAPTEEPVTGVWEQNGLRIVTLDSTVPGWHHGDVDAVQLAWLADVLAEPAEHGTLLAMHHPPVPSHIPFFDILELRHQDELAAVLEGTDVRGILAGHLHYSLHGTFAGIPVSVASATCYTMDVSAPAQRVNGMDAAQSFQLVHVRPEVITHTVVPVVDADPVQTFSPEWVAQMERLSPEQRLEAFSRKPAR